MSGTPILSVIIPTRNRPAQLRQSLASLAGQTYPKAAWEVIVVADGEEDPHDEEQRKWVERLPVHFLRQPHAGAGIARNTGAAQARGRYLIFTDDDCVLPEDWLDKYAQAFERAGDCAVAGRAINALTNNPYAEATQALMDYLLSYFNSTPERATLAISNNFGLPAEGFRELDGFSPLYFRMAAAEDRDFSARWLEHGRRILYAPGIVLQHSHVLNLRSFLRQHFQYGRGAYLFHRARAQRQATRFKMESPRFYFSLLVWPWSVCSGAKAWRLCLLFLAAQTAHASGYIRAWWGGPERA